MDKYRTKHDQNETKYVQNRSFLGSRIQRKFNILKIIFYKPLFSLKRIFQNISILVYL